MAFTTTLSDGPNIFQAPSSGPYVGDWIVDGLAGDDTLIGWNGNDTFFGSAGDDYVLGGIGLDDIYGDSGNDRLYGEQDADYMDGGTGSDIVNGGAGHDTLIGGGALSGISNADQLLGGAGNDLYFHDFAAEGISRINDLGGGELNNADILWLVNGTSLTLQWGTDRSTLFIFEAGEMDDGSFDNGVMITSMLSNLGARTAGTIENAFVDGVQTSNWLSLVEQGWAGEFG